MSEKHIWNQDNIDTVNVALVVLDKSGKVVLFNKQCGNFCNKKHDYVIGKNWFELLLSDEKLQNAKKSFESAMSGNQDALALLQNIEMSEISGERFINWGISVLRDKSGNIEGALCVGVDITKEKKIEKNLQFENEKHRALNSILRISLEDISLEQQLQKALEVLLSLSWLKILKKGGIFIVDDKGEALLLKAQIGLDKHLLTSCARVPFGHCLCGRAAASREIQYSACLDERHDIRFEGMKPHGHYNVPILSPKGMLGVIVVYLEHGHAREEREVEFLGSVGHTLAGLIEHRLTQDDLFASREKLSEAQEIAHLGAIEWNIAEDEIKLSDETKIITGMLSSSAKMTLKDFLGMLNPDDRTLLKDAIDLAVTKGTSFSLDYSIECPDGIKRVFHSYAKPIVDSTGKIVRLSGTIQDITEQKEMRDRLFQSATVFENTTEAVIVADAGGKIISANKAFTDITGYTEEEVIGKTTSLLKSGKHNDEFYKEMWSEISKIGSWQGEIWNKRKNGDIYPEWLNISVVKNLDGAITNYIGVFSDISVIKESQQKLDYLAHHDTLTGLPNRLLLSARMDQALAQARRNKSLLAVLFLDLDHFKNVNDSLGHYIGDMLIKEVASRIVNCVRKEDTVSRLGGDEFSIFIEEMHDSNFASDIASKIISALCEKYIIHGHEIFITCSIGISIFPNDGNDTATLLKNADSALYKAKEQGRNSYQYYTKELSVRAMERMVMENNLRHALERNELVVYYQPQVDMYSGEIVGMEALLRWKHPEIGLISPDNFIGLAEETGLIIPIGEWVLRTACKCAQSWIESGLPKIRMAVNLSSRQFNQKNLPEIIANILRETGLDSHLLEIELTERIVMEDAESSIKMIAELKKLNIQFSIDDFGTGYSSLSYLKRFPLERIKIDKSFVDNIVSNPEDAAIVQAIISMSHGLNLMTIAEGVETVEQLEFLRSRECDEVQGYYFSRPLPANEVEKLLRDGTKIYKQNKTAEEEKHILLLSSEMSVIDSVTEALKVDDYKISSALNHTQAMDLLAVKRTDVIICDQSLTDMDVIELLSKVHKMYPDTIRVLLIDYSDPNTIARAVNEAFVYKVISKPWSDEELREEVKKSFLYRKSRLEKYAKKRSENSECIL